VTRQVDFSLLKKYDVSGPRYTSYPTALQFNQQFGADDYLLYVDRSNGDPIPKPLSLYIHVPFCQSLCYYCGCNKIITSRYEKAQLYISYLHKEIELQASLFDKDRQVTQIHLGGGTPTFLHLDDIERLVEKIKGCFNLAPKEECEMGIEIDPRTTRKEEILKLIDIGFNRLSIGIQDFDRPVQIAINRLQSKSETLDLISAAQSQHIQSLSVDLIYGLPKQNIEGFGKTLDVIIDVRPDRIALYNYAHMPSLIKSQKLIDANDLPGPQQKLELLALAIEKLTAAGYCHIGMDHFSLPGDSLWKNFQRGGLQRNFQGYSTHSDCDIVGVGVSAISKIAHTFAQNHKTFSDYKKAIDEDQLPVQRGYALSIEDQIRADVIQHIMCGRAIKFEYFEHLYSIIFPIYFGLELEKLNSFAGDGLINLDQGGFWVTANGRMFLRNIAMVFDAYSQKPETKTDTIRFSKVL
jgi:oxygen-independent coproporphyrinogen-3 oxidase